MATVVIATAANSRHRPTVAAVTTAAVATVLMIDQKPPNSQFDWRAWKSESYFIGI